MHTVSRLAALAAALSSVEAAYQGFNYGNVFTDGRAKTQSDFEGLFEAAANLDGTDGGFTSARLYTMIQAGTTNDPISAIPAAINTGTTLLLGLWASAGPEIFANEVEALRRAIEEYGDQLDGLIAGISVGSEDLYRNSPTGIEANENPGANPGTIVNYFELVRDAIEGTAFADYPVGHVDTWTAWDNSSNQAVIDASDFVGFNGFAYFEDTQPNEISNGKSLFDRAVARTRDAVGSKPIWITETGWPVSGRSVGEGVPSLENAETFWKEVGCPLFGETNVWWYTFQDSAPTSPNPSFGVIGSDVTTEPLFDLSCDGASTPSSSAGAGPTQSEDDNVPTPSPTGGQDDGEHPPEPEPEPSETESAETPEPTEDGCDDGEYPPEPTSEEPPHPSSEPAHPEPSEEPPHPEPSESSVDVPSPPPEPTDDGEVPPPEPTDEPVPTEPGNGGNSTGISPPPVPTSDQGEDGDDGPPVEGAASSMSLSAACLAVMVAVAVF